MRKVDSALDQEMRTLLTSMGYELLGCEFTSQGKHSVFRVYVDSPKGITIDDCSIISRQLGAMMNVKDPFHGGYQLEVSSPGIDRPLFEIEHFKRFIGKQVKIKLRSPVAQRRQWVGVLQRVEDEKIIIYVKELEQEVTLPFAGIEKANLVGEVSFKP
jgi:ribosome maturation factor RimP